MNARSVLCNLSLVLAMTACGSGNSVNGREVDIRDASLAYVDTAALTVHDLDLTPTGDDAAADVSSAADPDGSSAADPDGSSAADPDGSSAADPDSGGDCDQPEICTNGKDDNCDRRIDWDDPECAGEIKGHAEGIWRASGRQVLRGWACFSGHDASIDVHVYVGGAAGAGGTFVKGVRAELGTEDAVNKECDTKSGTAHRFEIPIDDMITDHLGKAIWVHGITPDGDRSPNSAINRAGNLVVPSHMIDLRFSSAGPVSGMHCVQIDEPDDPDTWNDNYLCSPTDYGLRWSHRGPIEQTQCTKIGETADPHGWDDNYLCHPGRYRFLWSSAGALPGKVCSRWHETADSNTWDDNYLCWSGGVVAQAVHSQKCLDVGAWSQDNGAQVIQYDCNRQNNQLWRLESRGSAYRIRVVHSGKCLDVSGASLENGATVTQHECHEANNQLWALETRADGLVLKAVHSGKCLDVLGGGQDNGAALVQHDCHGGTNQLWRLIR